MRLINFMETMTTSKYLFIRPMIRSYIKGPQLLIGETEGSLNNWFKKNKKVEFTDNLYPKVIINNRDKENIILITYELINKRNSCNPYRYLPTINKDCERIIKQKMRLINIERVRVTQEILVEN